LQYYSPEVVKLLLEAGANPNCFDPESPEFTPLYIAVSNNSGPEVIKLLLEAGADPNHDGGFGAPLFVAVSDGLGPEVIKLLLEAGADPNQDGRLGTPLFVAVLGELGPEVIRLLLEAEADPNKAHPGHLDETPLSVARSKGNSEIVELLIEAGAK
jgi:ankyrin repeat protein